MMSLPHVGAGAAVGALVVGEGAVGAVGVVPVVGEGAGSQYKHR